MADTYTQLYTYHLCCQRQTTPHSETAQRSTTPIYYPYYHKQKADSDSD